MDLCFQTLVDGWKLLYSVLEVWELASEDVGELGNGLGLVLGEREMWV